MNAIADALALPDIGAEIERAIQRNLKGLEFLTSAAPAMGQTARDEIHRRGTLSLYHYRPLVDEIYRVPLLIVMATTNRGYILDLAPGQSMVEHLLLKGYDVYMVDWNAPRPQEKQLRIEDYVLDFIPIRCGACRSAPERKTSRSSATAWAACSPRCMRRCTPTGR